ncbi:type 1 glutamine amidotransferase domain-containing protein [Cereibacter azotoformans]|uniref:type 1 glutamine amidotransferase domain-containing protein n=1 Tax=Cereibacter azotoformans TaxID=43057 RepID=UPI003B210CE6
MTLDGKTIAILIAPRGTEDVEFVRTAKALADAGAKIVAVSLEAGTAETVNQDLDPGSRHPVDATVSDLSVSGFDGLVIPGGTVGADKIRGSTEAVAFVRGFFEAGKPVAAICHGPWALVEAGVLEGRRLTSFPSLATDIRNAGGHWTDAEVVVDQGLVTSRKPDDLEAFCARMIEEFAEGPHAGQRRSA